MASGTLEFTQSKSSGAYIDGKIVWSATKDEDKNNSDGVAKIYVRKGDTTQTLTVATKGSWGYSITFGGKTVTGSLSASVLEDWVLLYTLTVNDIGHNSDGTKSCPVSGYVTAPSGTSYAGHKSSGSGTAIFDTIPRASTIDSLTCATNYFNGALTYKYTPKSANYYNRCNIALNLNSEYIAVKTINLGKKAASQQTATVTLSSAELATIYDELPNTTKGTLRFTFRTYSDSGYSKQIGDAGYKEIFLNIPNNSSTQPSVSMTLTPVNSVSGFDDIFIQGKSKVKATLSAEGKNNATIKSYSMSAEGTTYDSGDGYTSNFINNSGNVTVTGYATDSRGFTGKTEQNITVLAYSKPKILPISAENEVIAKRCDKDGVFSDNGTYLKIMARRGYSKLTVEGVQKNFCQIRFRYKTETADSFSGWYTILTKNSLSSDEIITGALLDGALLPTNTYIVQVGVVDVVGEQSYTTITVPTDKVYMHRDGKRRSLSIGKYIEDDNTVDIAEDIDVKIRGTLMIGDVELSEYIKSLIGG